MNKRINIGTISMDINTKTLNYGSWLHSYAFQRFLNKHKNLECEILDYKRPDQVDLNLKYPAFYYLRHRNYRAFLQYFLFWFRHRKRYKKFQEFRKKHMIVSNNSYTQTTLACDNLHYDILICDSDTIWTPRSNGEYDEAYFLALPSMKSIFKIAYSPSMGNAVVPKNLEGKLKQFLASFDFISCRESYEKEVLSNYTDKEIAHVLDPVFLIDKEEYLNLIHDPYQKNKYVLIYQPVDENDSLVQSALEYAKLHSAKVIEISTSVHKKNKYNIKIDYNAGPIDFLSAIMGSCCVFTNSFHAICFCIIFSKQFFAFGRKDNLKVIDICSRFGLNGRYLNNHSAVPDDDIDYSKIDIIRNELVYFSKKWLVEAISSYAGDLKTNEQ